MSIETNPPAKGEAIDLLTAESRQRFAESYPEVPHKLQHNLHRHPLLEFERLAQLAEHLAEKGSVEYNLADLPIAVDGKPDRPDMTIGEMIRQVGTAGSWCVLQNIEQDPEYAQLLNDLLDDVMPQVESKTDLVRTMLRHSSSRPSTNFDRFWKMFER